MEKVIWNVPYLEFSFHITIAALILLNYLKCISDDDNLIFKFFFFLLSSVDTHTVCVFYKIAEILYLVYYYSRSNNRSRNTAGIVLHKFERNFSWSRVKGTFLLSRKRAAVVPNFHHLEKYPVPPDTQPTYHAFLTVRCRYHTNINLSIDLHINLPTFNDPQCM